MKIILNTSVTHLRYGSGIVVAEWGAWRACRSCFCPIDYERHTDCRGVQTFMVGGRGIVDVEFEDGKTRSIHRDWLRRPEEVKEAA